MIKFHQYFIVLGIAGAMALAFNQPWSPMLSQAFWLAANSGLVIHNLTIGQRSQAALFAVYWAIAASGIINIILGT